MSLTDKQKAYQRKYYQKYKDTWPKGDAKKHIKLKHLYGITLDQYLVLNEVQNGKCAICKKDNGELPLSVDHNHITKKVRGLLCRRCNSTLGWLEENTELMQAMIDYVKTHS